MEQNFLSKQQELLQAQIRECYGRITYTHKTHEKCADILLDWNSRIKLGQIILSVSTTGSFLATIIWDGKTAVSIGTILSTLLLALNTYMKKYELVEVAEKHKAAAVNLWDMREKYLSLLTDMPFIPVEKVIARRDELQKDLSKIYKGCPRTNFDGYKKAQDALKNKEDMTFSDKEIDQLLPAKLRKHQDIDNE